MKLRFLMSHRRKNSVRDKVIGKEWIYSDSERSTFHGQSVGHHRGQVRPWSLAGLVLIGCVISYANKWKDYSNYFGEEVEVSRIGATTHSLVFLTVPWNWNGISRYVLSLLIEDQVLVLSAILVPFDSSGFYVVSLDYVILSKVVPCPFPSYYTYIQIHLS